MPANRYRNAAGKIVPGVTTVIKNLGWNTDMLMHWANKVGREQGLSVRDVSSPAADMGNLVHLAVEADVKGEPFDPSELGLSSGQLSQFHFALSAWHTWKQQVNYQPVASELRLVSEQMQVGGQLDIVAMISGKLTLLDIKSGNGVYPEAAIQVAAYAAIWDETHPEGHMDAVCLLRLDKATAGFGYHWVPLAQPEGSEGPWPLQDALEAFMLARRLHNLKKSVAKIVGG